MPQLDILIFSLQISIIFFLGWSVYILLSSLILSQYLSYNLFKKIFWFNIISLINFSKLSLTQSFIHLINLSSQLLNLIVGFLDFYKLGATVFTTSFLKRILKNNFYKIKIIFLNLISYENKFGEKCYFNFLILKNPKNIFNKFISNKFKNKRAPLRLMVKFTRKYRLEEDETVISIFNKENSNSKKLNFLF